ncbi:DNA-processing protein DprA [Herbidospora solisilvae]|nr:DNA-processing protein DprA [Herbidospora solisilvae]
MSSASIDEQAAVLALTNATPHRWHDTASIIASSHSALRLIEGDLSRLDERQAAHATDVLARLKPAHLDQARELIGRTQANGTRLLTVLDEDYPLNLYLVFNRPPFLWVRGDLIEADERAVAVVGRRQAGPEGLALAARLAHGLAEAGITVVSGLARGIDTAAHTAALAAGGRTIAALGTGILSRTYPAENAELDKRIADSGAVVSQFWPDQPPTRNTFPLRNAVTSGLAIGTLIIEAGPAGGTKTQATITQKQGRRLFVPHALHEQNEWVHHYMRRGGVTVVHGIDDIVTIVDKLVDVPRPQPSIPH